MNAIAKFSEPRLPYHDRISDRFGIDKAQWKVLCEATYPSAQSPDAIVMALSYCRARKLDIFKRPIHIVPMWSSAKGGYVETVWPGISELRTTASRTSQYAGCEEAEFGPIVKETFSGKSSKGRSKGQERSITINYPEWCRITVVRVIGGKECRFVGPKTYWLESYAKWADTDVPNDMWAKRPIGQIEKCAEAASLRRAFPEEVGNELTAEEMHGQSLADIGSDDLSTQTTNSRRPAQTPQDNQPLPPELPTMEATGDQIEDAEFTEGVPGGEDGHIEEEGMTLLDEARMTATEGRRIFDQWYNNRAEFEIIELRPHMPELMKAAKTVDNMRQTVK